MGLLEKINTEIDSIDEFYSCSSKNNLKGQLERLNAHRFLIYSSVIGSTWKIAYGSSIILSLFDKGEYNFEKVLAMAVTAPAIPLSATFYGAFWAKLGSKELLANSWKKSKKETIKKITYYHLAGNLLHNYYKLNLGADITTKVAYGLLEKICEKDNLLSRLAVKTFDNTAKFSIFYAKYILPNLP